MELPGSLCVVHRHECCNTEILKCGSGRHTFHDGTDMLLISVIWLSPECTLGFSRAYRMRYITTE